MTIVTSSVLAQNNPVPIAITVLRALASSTAQSTNASKHDNFHHSSRSRHPHQVKSSRTSRSNPKFFILRQTNTRLSNPYLLKLRPKWINHRNQQA